MPTSEIVATAVRLRPDAVLFGHSGSTSGHPVIAEVACAIAGGLPAARIVYGGVFPDLSLARDPGAGTPCRCHCPGRRRRDCSCAHGGVRGAVAARRRTRHRLSHRWKAVRNTANNGDRGSRRVPDRLGIDRPHALFLLGRATCGRRAVLARLSASLHYCGQRGFWTRWRHRDPVRFAAELARLYREHGVRVINFADENPTVSK